MASVTPIDRGGVPLTGCDCFHLALDALMRRAGQGRNLGQAVVELDGRLDVARLCDAVGCLAAAHPLSRARLRRTLTGRPVWTPDGGRAPAISVGAWREVGAPAGGGRATGDIASAHALSEQRLSEPLEPAAGRNLRFDLLARADGSSTVIVTFAHVLLDAVGVELLLVEIDRLARGAGGRADTVASAAAARLETRPEPRASWRERFTRAAPSGRRLDELAATGFRSLAGARAGAGRARYRVVTLDAHDSAAGLARAARLCGPLVTMPFFLACAVRAHDRVFRARGVDPGAYVVTIPVQTRDKGARGPIFQNHVSILFFHVERAAVASVETIVASVRAQLATMMRARLDLAFAAGLDLARRIPSRLVIAAVRQRFHGEISSFFHSYTGSFAPELTSFLGVPVANAYHTPAVAAPPGTGLFVGERQGRLNLTLTWREDVLGDDEAALLLAQAVDDCCGGSPEE
jgi:hypothetical protein